MIKKADMKGWTPKKHLQGWMPEHGWIREGKTREHDPITVECQKREPALRKEASLPDGELTVERLERALTVVAYLIERDGPVVVPLFERLERELAVMRQTQHTMERAKRLLESYTGRHPRLSLPPPIEQIEDEPATGVHSTAPQPDRTHSK